MRGSTRSDRVVRRALDGEDLALGVLGNPLSDFAGLPILLRALERRGIARRNRARHAARDALGGDHDAARAAAARIDAPHVGRSRRNHGAPAPLVSVGSRADARIARALSDRRDLRSRRRDRSATDDGELCEELGDLLFQIVFHAQLATERGKFSIADVVDALSNKMIRRHPHVFGDIAVSSVAEVWQNWDQLKALEPSAQTRTSRSSTACRAELGALQRGQKMQDKAARVGFDWPAIDAHPREARRRSGANSRTRAAGRTCTKIAHVREELGDVIFTVVNLARALGVDAEGAMRDANDKFYRRFSFMERYARGRAAASSAISRSTNSKNCGKLAKVQAA